MSHRVSDALRPYQRAFQHNGDPFLHWHYLDKGNRWATKSFSRGDFWQRAQRAAATLSRAGMKKGTTQIHCFGRNHWADSVFRLAATMVGSVPVTINWQADRADAVIYKIDLAASEWLLVDDAFPQEILGEIRVRRPHLRLVSVSEWEARPTEETAIWEETLAAGDPKIVIFTSGTTGKPKGVLLTHGSYETNRQTFDAFMELQEGAPMTVVVVNPLHHANATAMTDWCLRRPHAQIHLFERYSTAFWRILAEIDTTDDQKVLVPLVSRHIDFLHDLKMSGRLPVPAAKLKAAMARMTFLVGSAPVGPKTVARLLKATGHLPAVRFGSTETCLQVMGTPQNWPRDLLWRSFQRGWSENRGPSGYFIGRPHPPYTAVDVVASIRAGEPEFMRPLAEGESGYLVTRGTNLMAGYLGDPKATAAVFQNGWYTGFMDKGFYLVNEWDGQRDYYWQGRESTLLIRGGANYAYEQIESELKSHLERVAGLPAGGYDLAVVGLRIGSEHEDACCVTLTLEKDGEVVRTRVREALMGKTSRPLSKGAQPDHLRFAQIPRNFKGAVALPQLKQAFETWLREQNP